MPDFAKSSNAQVQAQLHRIAALSPGRDILGLERITALMAVLGNPHHNLPPVFHVAGTNGKGSTCAFLRSALEADNKICHVYTSPHLVRFNERIRIAGTLISDEYLADILGQVLDAAEHHQISPSFFEVTTAAALLAFSKTPADACIIEVGLGGRLDATNIIDHPAACGIANLGIDHESFLLAPEENTPDDPLTRIAWEKAGIAKAGSPLVTGHYNPSMNDVISDHAKKIGAPLRAKTIAWTSKAEKNGIHYEDQQGALTLPLPSLNGAHQSDNAALAIAMLRHQNAISISDNALMKSMTQAHWPARLQPLSDGPLQQIQPDHTIWLDGGHNANAGDALAAHFSRDGAPYIHIIIGMLSNKAPDAIIGPLANHIKSMTILPVDGHDHHDVNSFMGLTPIIPTAQNSIEAALSALKTIEASDIILIIGSLYLAGKILAANGQAPN